MLQPAPLLGPVRVHLQGDHGQCWEATLSAPRAQLPHHYRSLDPAIRRELVDHAASDGFPISGVLYLPPHGEPLPEAFSGPQGNVR